MSWKPEVRTGNDPKFYANHLVFETKEEAEISAADLAKRWALVVEWRVVESDLLPNYRITQNEAGHYELHNLDDDVNEEDHES